MIGSFRFLARKAYMHSPVLMHSPIDNVAPSWGHPCKYSSERLRIGKTCKFSQAVLWTLSHMPNISAVLSTIFNQLAEKQELDTRLVRTQLAKAFLVTISSPQRREPKALLPASALSSTIAFKSRYSSMAHPIYILVFGNHRDGLISDGNWSLLAHNFLLKWMTTDFSPFAFIPIYHTIPPTP